MTPEQMKALMAYVVDTSAAVQDYRLHGERAERSRDEMLASFGLRFEGSRFENGDVVRVEQQPPAEPLVRPMPLHPDHEMNARCQAVYVLLRRRRPDLSPDEVATLTRDIALMWPALKAIMEPEAKP